MRAVVQGDSDQRFPLSRFQLLCLVFPLSVAFIPGTTAQTFRSLRRRILLKDLLFFSFSFVCLCVCVCVWAFPSSPCTPFAFGGLSATSSLVRLLKGAARAMTSPRVSPFTFVTWKEDENAVVAGTTVEQLGYIQVLSIDGIDIDAIVTHAIETNGEAALTEMLATRFPAYVAALAERNGTPCFVTSGVAEVEYADLNTGEVGEGTFDATEENYNEAVRIDAVRAQHAGGRANNSNNANRGPNATGAAKNDHNDEDEEDEDDYEDVEEDEDENAALPDKRAGKDGSGGDLSTANMLDKLHTQLQVAICIASDMGFTAEEIKEVYQRSVPSTDPVPQTVEECLELAEGNHDLQVFISHAGQGAYGPHAHS